MPRTLPAFVVAGTHSGAGKTTVAVGLMAALKKRGLVVQPFKSGARPFDNGYFDVATGRSTVNLDLWIMPPESIRTTFARALEGSGAAVVEGMRGLFDGSMLPGTPSSTFDLATVLDLPIILVVDAAGIAESVAAISTGFSEISKKRIAGVILNRVTGERHLSLLTRAIEKAGGPPVLGCLPTNAAFHISSGETGFVAATHYQLLENVLPGLVEQIEKRIDLDRLVALTATVPDPPAPPAAKVRARIAIARDAAFPFYYDSNLELLRAAGAELVPFSPLRGEELPDRVGAIYLGGGIPEVCSSALERNRPMRDAIKAAVEAGMPIYAECGGVMYLATNIVGTGVRAWDVVGALPGEIRLHEHAFSIGWVDLEAARDTFLLMRGEKVRGFDFRSFMWSGQDVEHAAYLLRRPGEDPSRPEGFASPTLHASFCHLHFASVPQLPVRFVEAAEAFTRVAPKKTAKVRTKQGSHKR